MHAVTRCSTDELERGEVASLRALLDAAWAGMEEAFTDADWEHAGGGVHFVVREWGEIVSHAAVVERRLHTNGRELRTGYVEAMVTRADRQRRGLGTAVMRDVGRHIRETFELGALDTGEFGFYDRMGWVRWQGPTAVRTPEGEVPTPDEDGLIMVLFTPAVPELEVTAPISCEWRPGDVW
ncbi:MAG TPA: GNAT family N-acetyltransferase [Actinomycetota bacterium]|nr:GNAT family N-acetyltransferase [Actinomycetota bacterium]